MTLGRLVIFDIDGTLCDTYAVDDECFCATASDVLGAAVAASSWEGAPHVTDSGILPWLWHRHLGRPPTPSEIDNFMMSFEATLRGVLAHSPERFRAMAGADTLLAHLEAAGWMVAIATGGWGTTARLKLRAAGLPEALLLASADDSPDRREIFQLAATRRSDALGRRFTQVVLVGDGVWDVQVAAHLGWSFVGVGRGVRAARLLESGAATVLEDFVDVVRVEALLRASTSPVWRDVSLVSG